MMAKIHSVDSSACIEETERIITKINITAKRIYFCDYAHFYDYALGSFSTGIALEK